MPERKTLLFGNGLGMALSSEAFQLDGALERVWIDGETLTVGQREAIRACLPSTTRYQRPSDEADLEKLQQVLSACDLLNDIDIGQQHHWLSTQGQTFPNAIRCFVHKVACEFHGTGNTLPDEFAAPLMEFISETKSHVATLNYDDLLYNCFIENRILRGYSGSLIDGIWRRGFTKQNLNRRIPSQLGWYLHLHGSPLFFDGQNGLVKKMQRNQLLLNQAIDSTHLVLSHARHKPSIIAASPILLAYWKYLELAFDESEEVILFGYSGYDDHLNALIAKNGGNFDVKVVEWSGTGSVEQRTDYWLEKLNMPVELHLFDCILDFANWG